MGYRVPFIITADHYCQIFPLRSPPLLCLPLLQKRLALPMPSLMSLWLAPVVLNHPTPIPLKHLSLRRVALIVAVMDSEAYYNPLSNLVDHHFGLPLDRPSDACNCTLPCKCKDSESVDSDTESATGNAVEEASTCQCTRVTMYWCNTEINSSWDQGPTGNGQSSSTIYRQWVIRDFVAPALN